MRLASLHLVLFVILITGAFSVAQERAYTDEEVLRHAKSIDVAKLDSTLPSQPLEDWLLHGPARIDKLNWTMSLSCDLKGPQPDADGELLCVKIGFQRGQITGFGVLRIGTLQYGIKGPPAFQYLDVLHPLGIGNYDKLSEFPDYLDRIPEFGTLCVYPLSSGPATKNSSVGQYDPAKLKLRIDDRPELPWPLNQPVKIEPLELGSWHVVRVRSGNKQVQLLEFGFSAYREGHLCLAFDASKLAHLESGASASWCRCK